MMHAAAAFCRTFTLQSKMCTLETARTMTMVLRRFSPDRPARDKAKLTQQQKVVVLKQQRPPDRDDRCRDGQTARLCRRHLVGGLQARSSARARPEATTAPRGRSCARPPAVGAGASDAGQQRPSVDDSRKGRPANTRSACGRRAPSPRPPTHKPWVNLYSSLPPHRRHAPCTQRRRPSDMPASRRSSQLPPAPSRRAARPSHESPAPQSPLALHKRAPPDWPAAPHWPAR
jgi:hypothetical protein